MHDSLWLESPCQSFQAHTDLVIRENHRQTEKHSLKRSTKCRDSYPRMMRTMCFGGRLLGATLPG